MDVGDVQRAIWRIAHEIVEHNRGAEGVVAIGLQTGGVWLASALAGVVSSVAGREVPVGALDVAYYRDDIGLRPAPGGGHGDPGPAGWGRSGALLRCALHGPHCPGRSKCAV